LKRVFEFLFVTFESEELIQLMLGPTMTKLHCESCQGNQLYLTANYTRYWEIMREVFRARITSSSLVSFREQETLQTQ